ncbi:MAG: peptidylprolyl isomerase [Xanthomonadales bacterium]|nr:peptidylprolyl isomerase [Xanthomonadales bacterium]
MLMHHAPRSFIFAAILCLSGAINAQPMAPKDPKAVIVAERDGVSVSLHEVDAQVMALPSALRARYLDDPERLEEVVQGLLVNKQLALQALARDVESDPFLETQLQSAREEWLARRARNFHEDDVLASMPDFEQLAEEIYKTHPHRFRRPVTLQLSHILVRIGGRGEQAAQERIEAARAALLAGELEFKDIYLEYSDEAADPLNVGGGVLTDVVPGLTEKPFEDAVFKLTEVGQVSEIIRTQYGFHVAKLMKRVEPSVKTWEEVKTTLIEEQRQRYLTERRGRQLAELQKAPIKADPVVVAQLRSRYARAAEGILPPALDGSEAPDELPENSKQEP